MPKTETQKAHAREYARRRYWADPERFRDEASEYGKRKRAADKAAGIPPKKRAPRGEAFKAANREGTRRRYQEDPEKYRAKQRERAEAERAADPDAVRARKRVQYWSAHEQTLERQRARRAREDVDVRRAAARARTDPVENRARAREWRKANPQKAQQARLRRRARKSNAPVNDLTAEQWTAIVAEFDGICAYCPAPATTQDHLTPLSRGGSHTALNIVPACRRCNSKKHARTLFEFVLMVSQEAARCGTLRDQDPTTGHARCPARGGPQGGP